MGRNDAVMSRTVGAEHRRALMLLLKSANGLSEALIQARGVPAAVIRDLVRAKLIIIEAQRRRGYGTMVVVKPADHGCRAPGATVMRVG
jgi:hypothetical protein